MGRREGSKEDLGTLHEYFMGRREGSKEEAKQQEAAAKAARLQEMQERLAAWQAQQNATQN